MTQIINARLLNSHLVTIHIDDDIITKITPQEKLHLNTNAASLTNSLSPITHKSEFINAQGMLVIPSSTDCHVHSRVPGFPEKEDLPSLDHSALIGGVGTVIDMPNTTPPTLDEISILNKVSLFKNSKINTKFFLGCNEKNLPQISSLLEKYQSYLAGVKVYYGNSTGDLLFRDLPALENQLKNISQQGQICVFHSEDQCRIDQRSHLDGKNIHSHSIVRDDKCAWVATKEILTWLEKTKIPGHIAHVSTSEEIEMIVNSRKRGANVSFEVCPHHLLFSTDDYDTLGSKVKVNPPVRSLSQVKRLRKAVEQHGMDCFATDHAPHTLAEKNLPYPVCPSGIPAIELFYPLLFLSAKLCNIDITEAVKWVVDNPSKMFLKKEQTSKITTKSEANLVFIQEKKWTVQQSDIKGKAAWSPYIGLELDFAVKAHLFKNKWYSRL